MHEWERNRRMAGQYQQADKGRTGGGGQWADRGTRRPGHADVKKISRKGREGK